MTTEPPPSQPTTTTTTTTTLFFPPSHRALLTRYLPPQTPIQTTDSSVPHEAKQKHQKPYLTLTYAHSLDASISAAPGIRTVLSGSATKAMTHFLRTRHDAILVGAGTAMADDPKLNSRLALLPEENGDERRQPRPVILDASARWAITLDSQVIREAREGRGLGPWVFVSCSAEVDGERERVVEGVGGKYIRLPTSTPGGSGGNGSGHGRFDWADILSALANLGIKSVMVEGGAEVIHSLLVPPGRGFVDVVVLTIAPVWLGQGGVVVAPPKVQRNPGATGDAEEIGEDGGTAAAALPLKLTDVAWTQMGQDVVLCGRIPK